MKKTAAKKPVKKVTRQSPPARPEPLGAEYWEKEYRRIRAEWDCMRREVEFLREEVEKYKKPLFAMLAEQYPVSEEALAEAEKLTKKPVSERPLFIDLIDELEKKHLRRR